MIHIPAASTIRAPNIDLNIITFYNVYFIFDRNRVDRLVDALNNVPDILMLWATLSAVSQYNH